MEWKRQEPIKIKRQEPIKIKLQEPIKIKRMCQEPSSLERMR